MNEALSGAIHSVRRLDPEDFPGLLRSIDDAPQRLFIRGEMSEDRPAVAIVGTRRPSQYGRRITRRLAADFARAGIVVVSGLARGVDTEAHRAAMAAGGRTWAVLGSGLDCVYPLENKPLADEIVVRGGCVISEYPPREGPLAWKFPRRNRIVSGLSWAVIVVEGGEKSGALITARTASEQGRDVFAVPGPVDSPMSAAPHRLLRNGAGLLRRAEDVMAEIPALRNCRIDGVSPIKEESFTLDEEKILQLLGSENLALEALVTASALPLPRLLDILTGLEARGIISALPGQNYGRI